MTAALLELLLPDHATADGSGRRERTALAAIQLARLLAGLGAGPHAGRVDLDLARATTDLDARLGAEAQERCEDLFRAHLERGRPGPALVAWPERGPVRGEATWAGLVDLGRRAPDLPLPSLPEPGEEPGAVARRLLSAAACLGLPTGRAELWRALLEHHEGEGARAEARLVELLDSGPGHALRVAAVEVLLGVRLERGAVGPARDLALAHLDLVASSPGLQRRAAWACLVGCEAELAAELALPTSARHLPPQLVTLGRRRPGLRPGLTGGASWDPAPEDHRRARVFGRGRRAEVGAALLAVFHVRDGAAEVAHLDRAPGLGDGPSLSDWLADRCLAPWDDAEPEHAVLATGRPTVAFPDAGEPDGRRLLRSCLSPAARALALVPIPGSGVSVGWLRLELEHELVPTDADLSALAAALGRRLGLDADRPPAPRRETSLPRAELIERIEPHLGGLARRRWWLLDQEDRVQAEGGGALEPHERGGGGLLAGARAAGTGRVLVPESGEQATFHHDARAGLVLPLGPGWSPAASWLVVEGTRAGDLGPRTLERWGASLAEVGRGLLLAGFAAWHREQLGAPVHLDPAPLEPPGRLAPRGSGLGTGELLERLTRAPAGSWLVLGPPGSGRCLAAHLAHVLQTGLAAGVPRSLSARGASPERLASFLEGPGARLLRDVETLSGRGEAAVLEALDAARDPRSPLLLAGDDRLAERGLGQRLGRALAGRVLALAPLHQRRRELAGILTGLMRREAAAGRALPPVLGPDLLPRIWRLGLDLTGLGQLARQLVDLRPGGELGSGDLDLVLEPADRPPRRLPSKNPDPRALWAALDGTRKAGGSFHRRRAARLLGWDPDTVSARIRDLGWTDLG